MNPSNTTFLTSAAAGPDWDPAQLQLSSQFLHQLGQYLLGFSLHWALSFRPLGFLFLLHGRLAILLQGSISLSFGIALRVL